MYIDPKRIRTFNSATPKACDKYPSNAILDPIYNEHYVLTPKPALGATQLLSDPKNVQSAIRSKTLTAQEADIFSYSELTSF